MNLLEFDFTEMIRILLTMSLTGSITALFLFIIKPMIKDRLPKSVQYYMWFAVLIALILPLSKIVVLPEPSASNNHAPSFTPVYNIVQWIFHTALKEPVRLISLPQAENGEKNLQVQGQSLNVAAIFFMVWLFGMFAFLGFNIICYILFVRKLKKYHVCASPHERALLSQLAGKGHAPNLCVNTMVSTPVLTGVFRPTIILPDKTFVDTQLQHILLHELTHLRRHDIAIKWFCVFLGALHWYNPVIYLVQREMSRACELACDEAVIKSLDSDGKRCYGEVLIAAAGKAAKIPFSTTMCEDKKVLKERLGAIMKHTKSSKKTIILSGIFLAVILCGTFYFGAAGSTGTTHVAATELTSFERQKHEKEIELKKIIKNYDKKNIVETWIYLGNSDNEITNANILIVSHEEITNSAQKDEIMSLAAENLNLDIQKIYIAYMDVETFNSPEKVNPAA